MKLTAVAAVAALGAALSGCATIVEGTTQPVSVNTTPVEGAQCTLTNSQGTWYVSSPGSVIVHKSRTALNVTCTKPGLADGHAVAAPHFGAATAGNILGGVGGIVIGGAVDAASGADYHYNSPITVPLGDKAAQAEAAPASEQTPAKPVS